MDWLGIGICTTAGIIWLLWKAVSQKPHPVHAPLPRHGDLDRWVEDLVRQMSTEEKLSQLSGDLPLYRFYTVFGVSFLSGRGAPVIYSGRNDRLGIPPFGFSDGPRGVNVGRGKTVFPVTMLRGASWDPDLEYRIGQAMARETLAAGANYSAAVCVNLLRHPGWGRAQETYGEDPHHLGIMGTALTRGLQSQHVMACVKHFALNSIENARFYVDVQAEERTLREVYLPHFKRIIQEGQAASVMSAYNRFRGEHCGHSHHLLTRILREDWGFEGFVSSDWLHGVRDGPAGLNAGMDVEMPSPDRYGKGLRQAVASGEMSMETVERSVRRVLKTRLRYASADVCIEPLEELAGKHEELALEAAEKSMVLLKNEGALPFSPNGVGKLLVAGKLADLPNTGDHGSSKVPSDRVVTPLAGIREAADWLGIEVVHSGSSQAQAEQAAGAADAAVVIVGFTHKDEGEYFVMDPDRTEAPRFSLLGGGDRADIALKRSDLELIESVAARNPRTVVVYVGGSAIDLSWQDRVPAILFALYGGVMGGTALARILFGKTSPSGKLPFSIPEDGSRLPPFHPFAKEAEYGMYHGYTLFEKEAIPVAAAFGYGLAYTRFACTDLRLDSQQLSPAGTLTATVRLSNTGERAGSEVVQLYVGFPQSCVDRPVKLLRAFRKVVLEAGSFKDVVLQIPMDDLAYWDEREERWQVEKTRYDLFIGTSSRREDLLQACFEIADR